MKRIGFILGRRIRGDIELGLDSSTGRLGEIIAPGARIAGRPEQDILVATTAQNYVVGSRRYMDDRVFHYCFAPVEAVFGGAPSAQQGCFTASNLIYQGDAATQLAVLAGVRTFNFAYTGGLSALGCAAHALAGGWFSGFGQRAMYRIEDNEAWAAGNIRITLSRPLWNGITGDGVTRFYAWPNIYRNCVNPDPGYDNIGGLTGWATVVAVPLINVTPPAYFWGQTWGPMNLLNGTWGANVGQTGNEREVHFDWLGRIVYRGGGVALDAHMQRAGYLLFDGREATGGDQLVFLQLAP